MREDEDQVNAVVILAIVTILALFICSARTYVNPEGGVCRYPAVARMFKMCRH